MEQTAEVFLRRAIDLATKNVDSGLGGPFGAVIVKDGRPIANGVNSVTSSNDPTAHAEIVAIRDACKTLNRFDLSGCDIYSSCEPCPMCLGAIYWSRLDRLYYASTREDAAEAGFDDAFIYEQILLPHEERTIAAGRMLREAGREPLTRWMRSDKKTHY